MTCYAFDHVGEEDAEEEAPNNTSESIGRRRAYIMRGEPRMHGHRLSNVQFKHTHRRQDESAGDYLDAVNASSDGNDNASGDQDAWSGYESEELVNVGLTVSWDNEDEVLTIRPTEDIPAGCRIGLAFDKDDFPLA